LRRVTIVLGLASIIAGACSLFVDSGELSDGASDGGIRVDGNRPPGDEGVDLPDDPDSGPGDPPIDGAVSYRDTILADKPIAYYRFSEAMGTVAADQTGKHAATYKGPMMLNVLPGALLNEVDPGVHPGTADASCIAVGKTIDFPDRSPFTAEIWVKFDAFDNSFRQLITKNTFDAGAGRQNFGIFMRQSDLVFERYVNGTGTNVAGGQMTAGKYIHIVGTYDGQELALYVDGVLAGKTPDTRSAVPSQAELDIGCSVFPSGTFSTLGVLDEAAIYDVAIPSARVLAHFHASGR
jgi:hypothetical protein